MDGFMRVSGGRYPCHGGSDGAGYEELVVDMPCNIDAHRDVRGPDQSLDQFPLSILPDISMHRPATKLPNHIFKF